MTRKLYVVALLLEDKSNCAWIPSWCHRGLLWVSAWSENRTRIRQVRLYHVNHKALSARFAHVGFGLENRHRSITWLDVAKGNLTGLCLSPMALCYPRFLLSVLYAGC